MSVCCVETFSISRTLRLMMSNACHIGSASHRSLAHKLSSTNYYYEMPPFEPECFPYGEPQPPSYPRNIIISIIIIIRHHNFLRVYVCTHLKHFSEKYCILLSTRCNDSNWSPWNVSSSTHCRKFFDISMYFMELCKISVEKMKIETEKKRKN